MKTFGEILKESSPFWYYQDSKKESYLFDLAKKLSKEWYEERGLKVPKRYQESTKKILIGTCKDLAGGYYSDATEMAQDLGYYATFDDFEDPKDSNYEEITSEEFNNSCEYNLPKHHFIFLRGKNIFIAYDIDKDIHYFYE